MGGNDNPKGVIKIMRNRQKCTTQYTLLYAVKARIFNA